jgi:glucose-6-phosphate 1-dehydrogenase
MSSDVEVSVPLVMIIFGATGDLTQRKLLPALYHLAKIEALPADFKVIAFARRPFADDEYRNMMRGAVESFYRHPVDAEAWERFASHIEYHQGEFDDLSAYQRLAERLEQLSERGSRECINKLLYLAVNPSFYDHIFAQLRTAGLSQGCGVHGEWTRVIIEKPFGRDLLSAQALNRQLVAMFDEDQIYRIDHYLGKETVQNILAFRFANGLFEPTWCGDYIDNVQITVAEDLGVGTRGEYYDQAGALRDVMQNHLLQLLSLVAMEQPKSLAADDIRDAKVAALSTLIFPDNFDTSSVRGQYIAGPEALSVDTEDPKRGYREEPKVAANSATETYVAMKLMLDSDKWQGVPFYVRTGKRMATRVTEINIEYKKLPADLFGSAERQVVSNVLTLRIQPNEGISLRMSVKQPGLTMALQPVRMEFCYRGSFADQPDAYERLLLDAMAGDQTLFLRNDEVEVSWEYMTRVLEDWADKQTEPEFYEVGSWGPAAADTLLKQDGREWLSHQIATCPLG